MKIKTFLFVLLLSNLFGLHAQNDTVFFMKNGVIVYHKPVADIDSILFYRPYINPNGTFTDPRDGNVYNTILIGNQVWMATNLAYLPTISSPDMGSYTAPHYYVNNFWGTDTAKAKTLCNYLDYGVLYNWNAALTACPVGWHLPTNAEWTTLTTYLGGQTTAGGKLKQTGTTLWNFPNTAATNETEFNAIPGGYRDYSAPTYYLLGNVGFYWSSSEYTSNSAKARTMFYNMTVCEENHHHKSYGFSVRCVMN